MIIKSTYFQRKEIHKATWRTPDGTIINKIDHVLIERDEEHAIKKVRTFRCPDADSDHYIVVIKITT